LLAVFGQALSYLGTASYMGKALTRSLAGTP
jgi:hypothetical protein